MQNTTGKLMGRMVVRKLAQDLGRRNVLLPNQGGYRAGKTTWENAARFAYDVYEGFHRKEQTLAVAVDLEDLQSAVRTADGTPFTIWRRLDSHKMARISTPGKKGCHATWKLHLHVPTTDNEISTMLPLSPVLCNVYTNRLEDLNSNGISLRLRLRTTGWSTKQPVTSPQQSPLSRSSCKRCHIVYKTASDITTAVTTVQEQL